MDDATKTVFKSRFIRLIILLNVAVLFFFLSAIFFFLLRNRVPFGTAFSAIFLILALILGFLVIRRYWETKAWLSDHT